MAEILNKYPDRFVAAVAGLPLNDIDASLRETDRAIKELKFKGIQFYSSINGKPLDRPELIPLYQKMVEYDLPIWLHPAGDIDVAEYSGENYSKYNLFQSFGWPYQTTLAMARLTYSGIMEKYPTLKIITHHCGGMLPFFSTRGSNPSEPGAVMKLTKAPVEYFRRFYADTVLAGNVVALTCGIGFFGADHLLFGTDYPYPGGANPGAAIGVVIKSIDQLKVSEEDKAKIFSGNARRLMKLS
jgi:aminocarboxymuconate-semialdehyde decarboxylase